MVRLQLPEDQGVRDLCPATFRRVDPLGEGRGLWELWPAARGTGLPWPAGQGNFQRGPTRAGVALKPPVCPPYPPAQAQKGGVAVLARFSAQAPPASLPSALGTHLPPRRDRQADCPAPNRLWSSAEQWPSSSSTSLPPETSQTNACSADEQPEEGRAGWLL